MKKSVKTFLFLLATGLLFHSVLHSIMIKKSLTALTKGADAIVLGRVEDVHCEWSLDNRVIFTVVTVTVKERLNGNFPGHSILIQYPGGEIEDIGLKVSDMPTFQTQEDILVFLKCIKNPMKKSNSMSVACNIFPAFTLFGYAQGKYHINEDGIVQKNAYTLYNQKQDPDKFMPIQELKMKIKTILNK